MVVSCQKSILCVIAFLLFLLIQSPIFAEVTELTDQQLDQIVATGISDDIVKTVLDPLTKEIPLEKSLSSIGSVLNQALLSSAGLIHVNAVDSKVTIQSNIVFLSEVQGGNINLSNVYESK